MVKKLKCKKCGHILHSKDRYCPSCRQKVYYWGKKNWIILGILVVFSIIANLFGYFYYNEGSLTGFVIITLVLTLGYVYLWYEGSPERVESKRRSAEERSHLERIRQEARAKEIGKEDAREHIHMVREERKFEDRMIKKHGFDKPVLEGFLGNVRETFTPKRRKRRKR